MTLNQKLKNQNESLKDLTFDISHKLNHHVASLNALLNQKFNDQRSVYLDQVLTMLDGEIKSINKKALNANWEDQRESGKKDPKIRLIN